MAPQLGYVMSLKVLRKKKYEEEVEVYFHFHPPGCEHMTSGFTAEDPNHTITNAVGKES